MTFISIELDLSPQFHVICNKFRILIDPDERGLSSPIDVFFEFTDDPFAGYTCVKCDIKSFMGEIVDDVKCHEHDSFIENVVYKIHAPGQVGKLRLNERFHRPQGQSLLIFSAQVQFHVGIDSINPFVVPDVVQVPEMKLYWLASSDSFSWIYRSSDGTG